MTWFGVELLEGAERLQGGWCHRGLFQGLDGLGVFPRPDQEDGPLENASSLLGLLFDLCGVAVAKVELGLYVIIIFGKITTNNIISHPDVR